ncbi:MAG TPA: cyanovirin [Janthinobacterium sp.]|nr:cyanovirin [Janthinobacterium sp.]
MSRFVPAGSYQKTASQINTNLYGKAQRRDQTWVASGFNITNLSGGLVNLDGSLQPENDATPSSGFIPNGSYKLTVESVSSVLSAYCQKRDGSWQWATLDITRYVAGQGDIANIDGELKIQ